MMHNQWLMGRTGSSSHPNPINQCHIDPNHSFTLSPYKYAIGLEGNCYQKFDPNTLSQQHPNINSLSPATTAHAFSIIKKTPWLISIDSNMTTVPYQNLSPTTNLVLMILVVKVCFWNTEDHIPLSSTWRLFLWMVWWLYLCSRGRVRKEKLLTKWEEFECIKQPTTYKVWTKYSLFNNWTPSYTPGIL